MPEGLHPCAGSDAVLVTMHGKERAVAPAFAQVLGLNVVAAAGVDTDALGTFSGETPRRGTMLEAAVAKARLGIQATGFRFAIASEGSFGPHAFIPFLPAGVELMVFLDAECDWVIHETMAAERTNFAHLVAAPGASLDKFLAQVGFPEHALIVRPNAGHPGAALSKGITDLGELGHAVAAAAADSADGCALVETDMRAHLNPTRMQTLVRLSMQLALRVAARCPACAAPGWGAIDVARGLPCDMCGAPTQTVAAEIYGCVACAHREFRPRRDGRVYARPGDCDECNP